MSGPGKKHGVKVYYFKPLCVEMGDQLILTTHGDLTAAITKIQGEVFSEYRRLALRRRPVQALAAAANFGLAGPRAAVNFFVQRRQRAIDAYQARLEFKRRKLALSVAENYRKCRTDGCTFDDALALTSPLKRTDVVEQYCTDFDLTPAQRDRLIRLAVGTIPWFLALSIYVSSAATAVAMSTPPLVMCDPAFVAEMPGSRGVVLKFGHFDEIAGVTHVEI
jgi:hypothetical protein